MHLAVNFSQFKCSVFFFVCMYTSADFNAKSRDVRTLAYFIIIYFFRFSLMCRAHENAMKFWRNDSLFLFQFAGSTSTSVCVCVQSGFFLLSTFPPSTTNFMATTANNEQTIIKLSLLCQVELTLFLLLFAFLLVLLLLYGFGLFSYHSILEYVSERMIAFLFKFYARLWSEIFLAA